MNNDLNIAMELMECFPGSFINHNGEFIAHRVSNDYFNFAACEDETDVKCKVLEWLSRPASKGQPFKTDRANEKFQRSMLDGINRYLGTNFSHDDIDEVYTYLGNRCNHARTLRFIESGYDLHVSANDAVREVFTYTTATYLTRPLGVFDKRQEVRIEDGDAL